MNEEMTKGYMKSFLSYVNSVVFLLIGMILIVPVVYSYLAHNRDSVSVYLLFGAGFIFIVVALIKMMVLLNKSKERF